ncbi:unnamed protein product [Nezara viridula]|uniref:Gustatory receptor n=1 Tax=Nezara viridula TaxID=85310 RepID=A0A9P0HJQ7_NEZVI|nr:unnamed protein product [Nezara viridula]
MNAEPKIHISILKEAVMPVLVVVCSVVHLLNDGILNIAALAMFMTYEYANFRLFIIENLIIFFLNVIQYYQSLLVELITPREAVLVKLCNIQDRLADVNSRIQKVYGFPLLCMVLSDFCFINVNMFFVVKRIKDPGVLIVISWVTIVFLMIFRIAIVCERMKEKGEEFYSVLYRVVKKEKTCKLLNNSYLRAHLLKKKTFSFNLAGFVEVDMNLVAGVISATATYTIILIQMGKDF